MTFQANIPLPTDLISVSQGDIKNNFVSVNAAWNINHVGFNATGAGKHNFVQYPFQGSDPATNSTEWATYTKTAGYFIRAPSNGAIIQLTANVTPSAANPGITFLPGGAIMQWGQAAFVGTNPTLTVVFPTMFPGTSFNVQATMIAFGNAVAVQSNTNSQFVAVRDDTSHAAQQIFWVAIGN